MPADEAKGLAELVAGFAELVATVDGFAELVATKEGLGERRGILIVALLEGPIDSKALDKNPVPFSIRNTPTPSPKIITIK